MLVADQESVRQDLLIEVRSRGSAVPGAAEELRRLGICLLEESRLFRLEGVCGWIEAEHLAVLFDPLIEDASIVEPHHGSDTLSVAVFCRPGVTDAEGETAALALSYAGLPDTRCHAGRRYRFAVQIPQEIRPAIERTLGNPLIHSFIWSDARDVLLPSPRLIRRPVALSPAFGPGERGLHADTIDLRNTDDNTLLALSRHHDLALDLQEMRTIAAYFEALGRAPTDVELQSIALTWSEHCCHKTFKAMIDFVHDGQHEIIPGLLQTYIVEPAAHHRRPWVRSAFVDNAGVVEFDRQYDLAFKVETHNHPSALEPYGGAHTGVGGVIRDVLGVSAEPIANTDVLCFGPLDLPDEAVPAGVFHPRTTFRGVVRGIADYGNNMGIPTVGGAVLFHPGYTANPLVYCGTLGLAPRGSHPRNPKPGDIVVLLGGRTGRDGLHGATMSSASLDRESVAGSGLEPACRTVQIGAPITEKVLRDVLPHLRDERLYHAITDCGAGGLCSAVGEMGAELGVEIDLARVPLKYEGLQPWEIWLSEAQERMVLAVPETSLPRLLELCRAYDVEASLLGAFRGDGMLRIRYGDTLVADMEMRFLHGWRRLGTHPEGTRPAARTLRARWQTPDPKPYQAGDAPEAADALLTLLAHPNIASKEDVIRRYDYEVQAATVVKPLVGNAGPSDAAVLRPLPGSQRGVVVAHGINPLYGAIDPHAMAMLAVDEALRNLVAVGGSIDRAALLDNFCWGDVDDPDEEPDPPEGLGGLVRAVQGCRDAALAYGVPFISGKDSLRNTTRDGTEQRSIPGTLLISALGVLPDVRQTVTMDLKRTGTHLYLLGRTADELGGSHYLLMRGVDGGQVPQVRPEETTKLMRRLSRAVRRGLILSCHDLSEGGLAVAAAEMSIAGRVPSGCGMEIDLYRVPADTEAPEALLFAESPGRFLVEVAEDSTEKFERLVAGLPSARLGQTAEHRRFVIRHKGEQLINLPLDTIDTAWRTSLRPDVPRTSISVPGVARTSSAGRTESGDPLRTAMGEKRFPAGIPLTYQDGPAGTVSKPHHPRPLNDNAPIQYNDYLSPARGHRSPPNISHHTVTPRALILTAPGVNCDRETLESCRLAGARTDLVHLNQLTSGERRLADFGMLVLPGGFSYGDHLGAGAMLATVLRYRLLEDLQTFIDDGRPVLGICNGFQALARIGLLGDVTLTPNSSGRFECRWVRLRVQDSPCVFLQGLERLELPIAHGQGRVVVAPGEPSHRVLAPLRYCENPNGSMHDIAGVCNPQGNVFGLMPHPERYQDRYHHPSWIQESRLPPPGLTLFQNAVRYVREAL